LKYRILIADDHAVVRAGYRQFLEGEPNVAAVGEVASGNDALDALRRERWNLVMLDIHMPDRGGLDILSHIVAQHPDVPVLVMSGLPEEQYARNVLKSGASGYLSKGSDPSEMLKAVRMVLAGRRYVSSTLAELLVQDLDRPDDGPAHGILSAREFQIFFKLAGGAAVSAIAAELSLSVKTVSTYRARVLEKMNFNNNADITSYAYRHGLMQ
jgi:two-component system invasion response regulator UvrY